MIDKSNFNIENIKNIEFFQSERVDIELINKKTKRNKRQNNLNIFILILLGIQSQHLAGCPSGLRGQTQVLMYSYSWVQIPHQSYFFFHLLEHHISALRQHLLLQIQQHLLTLYTLYRIIIIIYTFIWILFYRLFQFVKRHILQSHLFIFIFSFPTILFYLFLRHFCLFQKWVGKKRNEWEFFQ